MDENTFWTMIETARRDANGDIKKQTELLIEQLSRLSAGEIIIFSHIFDNLIRKSYRADLWDAAMFIAGSISDDDFIDVRKWLIAQGKIAFEIVLQNPDELANFVEVERRDEIMYEGFGYIASEAYLIKIGSDIVPSLPETLPCVPFGKRHKYTEYPSVFPKIAAKFGNRWSYTQDDL